VTYEVQIVLRSTDPAKLSSDVRAVAEFIEKLKRDASRPAPVRHRHLQAMVSGA
jgi:ribosomal protein S10